MKKILQHPYLLFSLLFSLIALIVFGLHLLGGGTLIWGGDGIAQHYPALVKFHQDLQNFIFRGKIPDLWQWNIGLGQDYIQTFSYYLLGDPFVYPIAFLPESFLPDYYSIMIIIRLYCAGLAFIFAARYFIKASNFSLALGAIVYVFSGYSAYSSFSHPFFLNPLIIFPILIVSLNRLLKGRSIIPFILMVALTLWVNFYFAYILALGTVIYWIIELVFQRDYRKFKNVIKVILGAITGFLLSAVLSVPSIYFLMNSARTGGQVANGLKFYPFSYYIALPGTLLVPRTTSEFWLRGGIMGLGLLGALFVCYRFKQYRILNLSFIIAAICLLFPVLCGIFNGFSSPSNRWLLLMQLPLGIASVILVDHYKKLNKIDFRIFVIFSVIMGISLLLTSDFGKYQGDLGMLIFQFIMFVVIFLLAQKYNFKIKSVLVILTIFNASSIFLSIQPYSVKANNKLYSKSNVQQLLANQRGYQKENISDFNMDLQDSNNDKLTFSRSYIDTQLPGYTYHPSLPILSSVNSFETYWSLENDNVYQFMHQLGVSNSIKNDVTGNGDLRDILLNYLGVSQIWLNRDAKIIPASYQNYDSNIYNDQISYLSNSAFPLFYFPKHLISNKSFAEMNSSQKEASLLDSVAVKGGYEHSSMAKKVQEVPFYNQFLYFSNGENIKFSTQTPEQLKLLTPSAQVILMISANPKLNNQELHLEFNNLKYQPFNFMELWQADQTDYIAKHNNNLLEGIDDSQSYNPIFNQYRWLGTNYLKFGRVKPGYKITANYVDQENSFKQLSPRRLSGYELRRNVTLNLGPAVKTNREQWILLNTDVLGHFSFNLNLFAVPTGSKIKKATKQIRQISHENLDFKLGHDRIHLKVRKPIKKVVATTIPYSPGWRVNYGEIVKVNGTFIGIKLAKGHKYYQLKYQTPFLNLAAKLSIVGIIFILFWGVWEFWKNRTNKKLNKYLNL